MADGTIGLFESSFWTGTVSALRSVIAAKFEQEKARSESILSLRDLSAAGFRPFRSRFGAWSGSIEPNLVMSRFEPSLVLSDWIEAEADLDSVWFGLCKRYWSSSLLYSWDHIESLRVNNGKSYLLHPSRYYPSPDFQATESPYPTHGWRPMEFAPTSTTAMSCCAGMLRVCFVAVYMEWPVSSILLFCRK